MLPGVVGLDDGAETFIVGSGPRPCGKEAPCDDTGLGCATTDVHPRETPVTALEEADTGLIVAGVVDTGARRSASFPRPDKGFAMEERSGVGMRVSIRRISWTLVDVTID
jgi:hypothetical protein